MKEFYTEIFINASTETVWNAWIDPQAFFKSFFGAEIRSSFQIGEAIEYVGTHEGQEAVHIYGKVLEYEKEKVLAYTDHPGPMYSDNHAKLESRVRVVFEQKGPLTRLSVTNDQFSENNPMQEEAKQWYLILSNLKTYVETGSLMKTT